MANVGKKFTLVRAALHLECSVDELLATVAKGLIAAYLWRDGGYKEVEPSCVFDALTAGIPNLYKKQNPADVLKYMHEVPIGSLDDLVVDERELKAYLSDEQPSAKAKVPKRQVSLKNREAALAWQRAAAEAMSNLPRSSNLWHGKKPHFKNLAKELADNRVEYSGLSAHDPRKWDRLSRMLSKTYPDWANNIKGRTAPVETHE